MSVSNRHSSAALRALSLALALACAAPLHAQVTHTSTPAHHKASLSTTIKTLLADPKVSAAQWGISVTALDGTPIYALNDAQLFQPDSNTKLFTTATALALLGPKTYFITTVDGEIDRSDRTTIDGNLTLTAGGDANPSGRLFPYQAISAQQEADPLNYLKEFADTVARHGIKHITGDIVVSDAQWPWEPYASGWNQDDLVWNYGAPVSAFSIDDNYLNLTTRPAATIGESATFEFTPALNGYYSIVNHMTTVASGRTVINIDRSPSSHTLTIGGSIALKSPPDKEGLSIDDPASYAATAFKDLLEADGITVSGNARADHREYINEKDFRVERALPVPNLPKEGGNGVYNCADKCPLVTHYSPTVLEDVALTNKFSLNLHADMLLKHLGHRYGSDATFAQGARVVRQFAINAGIRPDDFYFVDGSGLSTYDLAAPRAFTALLRYAATQPWGSDFKSSLPIGGVDGTLKERFTAAPLRGNVIAKTGTHSEGRALSGYLTCASGRTVVFSILDDHHLPGTTADRDVMDKIVAAIYSAN